MTSLSCDHLSLSVGQASARLNLLEGFKANFHSGDVVCLLGQNGSGKTRLLHTLAGLHRPDSGVVTLNHADLSTLPRKLIAQHMGLVTQAHEDPFPLSVFEHALTGRHPYLGLLAWETEQDKQCAHTALTQVGLENKKEQDVQTLSGGERKRLAIARVLTQNPDIILWDEPTNHLDPAHQKQTLELITDLQSQGKTQIIALHDINHAARIATHIIYLMTDGQWCFGTVDEMLTVAALQSVYNTHFQQLSDSNGNFFVMS